MRCGRTFRLARTHPARARSSGSETLLRSRSLADYTIDMHESEFSEATAFLLPAGTHVVACKYRNSGRFSFLEMDLTNRPADAAAPHQLQRIGITLPRLRRVSDHWALAGSTSAARVLHCRLWGPSATDFCIHGHVVHHTADRLGGACYPRPVGRRVGACYPQPPV